MQSPSATILDKTEARWTNPGIFTNILLIASMTKLFQLNSGMLEH